MAVFQGDGDASLPEGLIMLVQDIMSREVASVDVDATLLDAAVKMKLYDIGMVVVLEQDQVAGILTDRNIVIRGVAESADPTLSSVRRFMSSQVFTCPATDTLEQATRLMQDKHVRRLLVVDERQQPVGVLSLADVARKTSDPVLAGSLVQELTAPPDIVHTRPYEEE